MFTQNFVVLTIQLETYHCVPIATVHPKNSCLMQRQMQLLQQVIVQTSQSFMTTFTGLHLHMPLSFELLLLLKLSFVSGDFQPILSPIHWKQKPL